MDQVLGMDKAGGLALSWNGLPISMKLQQGTVTPMQQQAPTFSTVDGMGALSTDEEINGIDYLKAAGKSLMKLKEQNEKEMASEYEKQMADSDKMYSGVGKDTMDMIRKNAMQSPHMSDEDKQNIIHYDEFMQGMKDGTLKEGVKYFIPALQDDGNVDFHIFQRTKDSNNVTFQPC
jgi:hypothetical protein